MQPPPPRRRRARPVADAPLEALLLHVEDLAKGWLLAVIEEEPLERAPEILTLELVREGPRICEAVVRALASDSDLRQIEPGGALDWVVSRGGEIAAARGAEAGSRAVEALRAVIWSALHEHIKDPFPEQLYDLAERLSLITELLRRAALRAAARPMSGAEEAGAEAPERPLGRVLPRDARWISALEDEIVLARHGGHALSLLLVELEDAGRILNAEAPEVAEEIFERFEQAVRSAMRPSDLLACETGTRAWIIVTDTGRKGARALAKRVSAAVGAAEPWRGAPLTLNAGLAVLGEDGEDAAALIDAAEQARFEAAASGKLEV